MRKHSKGLSIRQVCVLAVCALFWSTAALAADKQIDLQVVDEGGTFKLRFLNSECPLKPTDKGCIEAEKGNAPMLMWELDKDSNDKWMLFRLQFSPDGQHWGDPAYQLTECTVAAFSLTQDDRATGNASTTSVTGNGRKLQIHDRNDEECMTHYKIFAMPRAGGAEINSDPVIDNKGK